MVYTKTSVVIFANQADADAVIAMKQTENVGTILGDTHPSDVTTDGDNIIVKRNWGTESSASAWVQYMQKLATKAGVSLVSATVVDYTE